MRKVIYNWDLDIDTPYLECQVGDVQVFIFNPKAEAKLPHWLREEIWNDIIRHAEGTPPPLRRESTDAEIIDIDDLRAKREVRKAGQG